MKDVIYQALENAGWYKGREIDIAPVLHSYVEYNLILSSKAIDIFKEFYGLKNIWYFDIKFPNNNKSFSVKQIEFEFQLFSVRYSEELLKMLQERCRNVEVIKK